MKTTTTTHPLGDAALASLARRAVDRSVISDAEGLRRAYEQGDAYSHNGTLYVAGSHTVRDWWDDFTKIPFNSSNIHRLHMAKQAAEATKSLSTVVGHSLGGAVALKMQQERKELKTRTYGAPIFDPLGQHPGDRYRSYGDPVSFLDRGAKSSLTKPSANISLFHGYDATASKRWGSSSSPPASESFLVDAVQITE